MNRFKYFFKLISTFSFKYKATIFLSIFFGLIIFFILNLFYKHYKPTKQETIGITGRYQSNNLPINILQLLSVGLTTYDEELNIQPGISTSWKSDDGGKTWDFIINENYTWQDGSPITSKSIKYEFSDVVIEYPSRNSIKFTLENKLSSFPSILTKPVFKRGLIGNQDWYVDKISFSGNFVKQLSLKNGSLIKIFKFYPTYESSKTAFKLGKVDKIIDLTDPSPFNEWANVGISKSINRNQVVTLFFNTKNDYLSGKEFRQSLFYAINKDKYENRALGPISPNSWAYNPQVKSYSYDIDNAKNLLKNSGIDNLEKITLNLVSTPVLLKYAEDIKNDWENIGIKTNILVSSIIPSDFDVYLTTLDIPIDPDQYSLWHSTQSSTNISKYSSPRIDKILEDGRSTINKDERKSIYYDFQRFLLEDVPAAFLFYPVYYQVSR